MNSALIALFIIGFVLNGGILAVYTVAIFSKRTSEFAIKILVKILRKFRIKNVDTLEERLNKGLESYQASSKYIKENKIVILKTVITVSLQIFLFYSITYFVYCSLGLKEFGIFTIVGMQAVVYTSTSGIPLPGAVGISEGSFIALFKNIFEENVATSAMLLSRGINFYFLLILSGIVILINAMRKILGNSKSKDIVNIEK